MIYVLIAIIVLLSIAMVYISIDFKRAKHIHEEKVNELNFVIVQLLDSQKDQIGKLKLSDELKEKLKKAREIIDRDFIAMQFDSIKTLSENNLLDETS